MKKMLLKRALITVGTSASGKSTYAKNLCELYPNLKELNRDDIRFGVINPNGDWTTYEHNDENEKRVTDIYYQQLDYYSKNNNNVIISDTNLNYRYLGELIKYLRKLKYVITIVEFEVSLNESLDYDKNRNRPVGYAVIEKQHQRYIKYKTNFRPKILEDFQVEIINQNTPISCF